MAQFHVLNPADESATQPAIRRISFSDLREALARGWDDFLAWPTTPSFYA